MSKDTGRTAETAVLCDFDGTIAADDVGHAFFRTFAGPAWEAVVHDWEEGRIGSRECLEKECALARATPADLETFAGKQTIDPGFADLVRWARDRFFPVAVVSDGFREYIAPILGRHGVEAPVFANRVAFNGDRLTPSFPYFEQGCGRCANCKGYHVGRYADAGYRTVFIGDGLSDLCALPRADLVLAKDALAEHCDTHGVPYRPYTDLADALRIVQRPCR